MNYNKKYPSFRNSLNYGDEDSDNDKNTSKFMKILIGLSMVSIALSLGTMAYIHITNRNINKRDEKLHKLKKIKSMVNIPYEHHNYNQNIVPYKQHIEMSSPYSNIYQQPLYNYNPTPSISIRENYPLTRGTKKNYKKRSVMPMEHITQNNIQSPHLNVSDYTLKSTKNVWGDSDSEDEYDSD